MSALPKPRSNKVLLVDGELRTSQLLAELLSQDGFEVEVVRDGAEAIARLSQAPPPGVLITELRLQRGDGVAIARYGRSQNSALDVVVVTRYPNQLVPAAFGSPSPIVLTKPVDYARLLQVLQDRREQPGPSAPPPSPEH